MNAPMTICFVLASRSRPTQFFATLDMLSELSNSDNYFVVAKLDTDDKTMNNATARDLIRLYPKLTVRWGLSDSKIDAINRSLGNLPHWDILVNLSDDQKFIIYGFDEIIRRNMPEDLDAFLHFPDSFAKDRVATMSIMGKKYYDRFGYIYHREYYSLFCDNEETEKAKILGKYHFINENIFDHYHYSQTDKTKKVPKDELYVRNDTYRKDERIFNIRKQKNFDLPK